MLLKTEQDYSLSSYVYDLLRNKMAKFSQTSDVIITAAVVTFWLFMKN